MGKYVMNRGSIVDVGRRIRDIRVMLQVQQKEMAAALQIECGYLAEIEKGAVNPGADFFLNLVYEYDVNPSYLLLGSGDMFLVPDRKITGEEIDLNMEIDSIHDLVYLMEKSSFFKNIVLASANSALFQNSDIIKRSLQKRN